MHEGVRGHSGLVEVLRNRSGDDFNSLNFLHGFFRGRADPFEAVLCGGRREKNQSSHKRNLTRLGPRSYTCHQHPPSPAFFLQHHSHPLHAPGTTEHSTSFPGWLLPSITHHKGGTPRFSAPCIPTHPSPQSSGCSALPGGGDRAVHPRHPRESWTQARCLPTVPAGPAGNTMLKLQQLPAGTG